MSSTVGNYGGVLFQATAGLWGNGTADTGPILWKQFPWGKYKNFQLQLVNSAAAYGITVYGTMDPNTASGAATGAAANWMEIPAPATQSGIAWANPITPTNPGLYFTALVLCLRLVVSAFTSGNAGVLIGVAP